MGVIIIDDPIQGLYLYKNRFSSVAVSKHNPLEATVATTSSLLFPISHITRIQHNKTPTQFTVPTMRNILGQLFGLSSATFAFSAVVDTRVVKEHLQLSGRNAPSETSPTVLYPQNVSKTPLDVFTRILTVQPNPDPDVIRSLVTFDATYISMTFDSPALHKILPWAGTRYRVGPQAFLDTFTGVGLWWQRGPFEIQAMFGDGGNVTAWGSFTLTSTVMNKTVTSPWSARAEVNSKGLITYFMYMEDTFTTTSSFWDQGSKEFTANPFGGSVWL